jgi:hypothetical protein
MSNRNRRIPQGKKMKPTFFVFCEGKTEELYVKYLKSKYRIPFEIDTQISKSRISEKYIKAYKKTKFTHPKDKTFLLYDIDVPTMLKRLQEISQTTLLASNPCIELWFLLHYKNQTANVDCRYCIQELKNRNKTYSKTVLDIRLKTHFDNNLKKAESRAKKLKHYDNPSTTVYLLIKELEKLSEESKYKA